MFVYYSGAGQWFFGEKIHDNNVDFIDTENICLTDVLPFRGIFKLQPADEFELTHKGIVKVRTFQYSGLDIYPNWAMKFEYSGIIEDEQKMNCYFVPYQHYDKPDDEDWCLEITNDDVVSVENSKKEIQAQGRNQLDIIEPHQSKDLRILNSAADRFWRNAERTDRDTHPTNEQVSNWLKQQGFSEISAKQGASIIRPEWAATGRPPKK